MKVTLEWNCYRDILVIVMWSPLSIFIKLNTYLTINKNKRCPKKHLILLVRENKILLYMVVTDCHNFTNQWKYLELKPWKCSIVYMTRMSFEGGHMDHFVLPNCRHLPKLEGSLSVLPHTGNHKRKQSIQREA